MKEKKTVACVVLGVSLVSLITVIVAAFAQSIDLLADEHAEYGGVTLGAFLLGTAFTVVFCVNKKHRFAVNLSLAIAAVAYCVISLIAFAVSDVIEYGYSSVDSGYLATALTLIVSTALTFGAWLCLTLIKKKEESAPAEQTSEKSE